MRLAALGTQLLVAAVLLCVVKTEASTTLQDIGRLTVRPPRDFDILEVLKFLHGWYQSTVSEAHQKVIRWLTVLFGEANDMDGGKAFVREGCDDVVWGVEGGHFFHHESNLALMFGRVGVKFLLSIC